MNHRTLLTLSTVLTALSGPASGQSLQERAGFGGTMSAADLTAILVAEIELCEQRVPEFRTQGSTYIAKFRTDPHMKEIERQPGYKNVMPEARALVQDRVKSQDLPTFCRNTLNHIRR